MKKLFLLATVLFSAGVFAQKGGKDFYYADYKWTMKIPTGYETIEYEPEEYEEYEKVIFVMEHTENEMEAMEATQDAYDPEEDLEYAQMQELYGSIMKMSLEKNIEGAEVELTSNEEIISGLTFYHHELKVTSDDIEGVYFIHLFSALIDGKKDFCMDISYLDEAEGERMLKAFRESTFKK